MNFSRKESRFGFEILLVVFILLLFLPGFFTGSIGTTLSWALLSLNLFACLYLVSLNRREFLFGITLVAPAMIANWMPPDVLKISTQMIFFSLFEVIFLLYIVSKILSFLIQVGHVNSESIYAAVCLYMIIGLAWTFVYFLLVSFDQSSINLIVPALYTDRHSAAVLFKELLYFSYVTQTTLGYGDLSPSSEVARAVAMVQALLGQIYIAVIVARIVGLEIIHATREG